MRLPSSPRARRAILATLALGLTAPLATLGSSPATAADKIPFYVVGTSDVTDSGLTLNVIKPGFEAAYPQYDLQYTPLGTGAALNAARGGSYAAAIVHAASIENGFVGDGFSTEPYGRAVFWGDFVLAGPADDPAGVLNGSTTDIVTAFQKIAAAGADGHKVDFVTRGGTPGTTVQEHAIWALTTGVALCNLRATPDGGGSRPSTTNVGGDCPLTSATPPASDQVTGKPDWYGVTGSNQGANVNAAETCPTATYASGKCYVFTDRGTFNFRQSQGLINNLGIVTRGGTVPGQENLLVNSFHAYSINPDKFTSTPGARTDPVAAKLFLDWLTSPTGQAAVGGYLNGSNDPPFLPSAAPKLTTLSLPTTLTAGTPFSVLGSLTNVVPGTPALDGIPVKLFGRPADQPTAVAGVVATGTTNAAGIFSLSYTPQTSMAYSLGVDPITKIEVPTLTPPFGDLLQGVNTALGTVTVTAVIKQVGPVVVTPTAKPAVNGRGKQAGSTLKVKGAVSPAATGSSKIKVYAGKVGQKLRVVGKKTLSSGASSFTVKTKPLVPGTYKYKVKYVANGATSVISRTRKVTIR